MHPLSRPKIQSEFPNLTKCAKKLSVLNSASPCDFVVYSSVSIVTVTATSGNVSKATTININVN
jgi:hypothetical protein